MADFDLKKADRISQTCAVNALRKAERAATQIYDDALRPTGLRITQLNVLTAIRKLEPISVKKLARSIVMDRTTLTRNLKPLEREGLIQVNAVEDRRVREISLTPAGHRELTRAYRYWEQAQTRLLKQLGAKRMRQLVAELSETSKALQPLMGAHSTSSKKT